MALPRRSSKKPVRPIDPDSRKAKSERRAIAQQIVRNIGFTDFQHEGTKDLLESVERYLLALAHQTTPKKEPIVLPRGITIDPLLLTPPDELIVGIAAADLASSITDDSGLRVVLFGRIMDTHNREFRRIAEENEDDDDYDGDL